MKDLYNRLAILKIILNSHYGTNTVANVNTIANVYDESFKIRKKIHSIKTRKEKIKRIFNG